ncbi:hypothetical protein BDZ97DRAFT_1855877 [Flammula alnicola]|nr:hypothetical protein BDZ97DRAFT_1855877 [Flammula alnicola]
MDIWPKENLEPESKNQGVADDLNDGPALQSNGVQVRFEWESVPDSKLRHPSLMARRQSDRLPPWMAPCTRVWKLKLEA